jgi:hypothetical protein
VSTGVPKEYKWFNGKSVSYQMPWCAGEPADNMKDVVMRARYVRKKERKIQRNFGLIRLVSILTNGLTARQIRQVILVIQHL